jgi:hypothetical protein
VRFKLGGAEAADAVTVGAEKAHPIPASIETGGRIHALPKSILLDEREFRDRFRAEQRHES